MSAIDAKQVWSSISNDGLDSKYEKCRHITEEIYKRIDITFQIKKLETGTHSDDSDQSDVIDSNELSNETDLFACDKSSISSSEPERQPDKYININNNEELKKKAVVVSKRPRKRFRKRVKKRQPAAEHSDSDASSDSALPLSRMVVDPTARPEAEGDVMGVPNIIIITKDFKSRIKTPDRKPSKQATDKTKARENADKTKTIDKTADKAKAIDKTTDKAKAIDKTTDKADEAAGDAKEKVNLDLRSCDECSLSFRGERGLRRHINMTHFTPTDKYQQGGNPFQTASAEDVLPSGKIGSLRRFTKYYLNCIVPRQNMIGLWPVLLG